jgi:hypothetical protein
MTAAASNSPRPNAAAIALLAEVFSSNIRAEVLAFMVPRTGGAYSLTELARTLGLAVSSVQHECYKLERLHLIAGKREGASRRYRLSADHPLISPLQRLVLTALGLPAAFDAAMEDCPGLTGAILTTGRSMTAGVELTLIGDLDLPVMATLQQRIAILCDIEHRLVNVSFYAPSNWETHRTTTTPLRQRLQSRTHLASWGITT